MKKICVILVAILLFSICTVYADDVSVIATYKSAMKGEQGVSNWYYVCFNGDDYMEMGDYNTQQNQYGVWNGPENSGAKLQVDGFSPGWVYDVGLVFKAPMKGIVRISGLANFQYSSAKNGDGAIVSVEKAGTVYWKETVTYDSPKECSVEIPVKANERIYVRINKNKNDAYDQLRCWPVAEYLAKAYTGGGTEGYQYLQRCNDEIKELEFDSDSERFNATDGIGYMSDDVVLPSKKCSMIKRFEIPEDGRYRINGTLSLEDRRCGGNIVNIYKNDELLWQQLVPESEEESFDIRVEARQGDIIDVEAKCYKFEGFNNMKWSYKITKFDGVLPFANTSSGSGDTYGVYDEFTLSSKVGDVLGAGTSVYALYMNEKYPMTYDSGTKKWTYAFDDYYKSVASISGTSATLGQSRGDVGVDLTIERTGTLKLQGEFSVNESTNGILTKIYLNDKQVWINREGGDALGRYDEPYDSNYFQNKINLTLNVKKGDRLTLVFGRWLGYTKGNSIDFSKVKFKYVNGEILSKTTKWKLEKSIVIDTLTNTVYYGGINKKVNLIQKNYTNYISEADAAMILGDAAIGDVIVENGVTFIPVRAVSEARGKNVLWQSDRLIIIYEGLPMMYSVTECSEIDVALKGGNLFD